MNAIATIVSHAASVLLALEADQGNGQIPTRHSVHRLLFSDYLVLVSLPDLVLPASNKFLSQAWVQRGPLWFLRTCFTLGTEHPI